MMAQGFVRGEGRALCVYGMPAGVEASRTGNYEAGKLQRYLGECFRGANPKKMEAKRQYRNGSQQYPSQRTFELVLEFANGCGWYWDALSSGFAEARPNVSAKRKQQRRCSSKSV